MQNTFTLPSEAQVQQQMLELQARFGLTDNGLYNVLEWIAGDADLEAEGEEKLMAYYLENGMPYREAKAIDADPYQWIRATMKKELGLWQAAWFC